MHALEELKEMLMEELEKCSKKGELSAGSLEVIDKLAHAVKSIDTIMAMEGYSEESGNYGEYNERGGNYGARGRGRNAQRDSRGRYADGYGGYREGRMYRRYREDAREDLVDQLKEMEMEAKDEEFRRMVQKWIRQAEQA